MRFTNVAPLATNPAMTSAADARKSLAMIGAPLSGRPPFTIALGPSIAMSAPSRASSLTCMKRDSKIRSVMMLMPGVSVMSTIICACASVGNPFVLRAVQFPDAGDCDGGTARADNPRAHRVEKSGQVHHFRLACGALDQRHAFGQDGGHHHVGGAQHGRPRATAQKDIAAG